MLTDLIPLPLGLSLTDFKKRLISHNVTRGLVSYSTMGGEDGFVA